MIFHNNGKGGSPMEKTYYIGDIADQLGINKETIRYYEKTGLLNSPRKGTNGYRLYSLEDFRKIRFIRVAKSYGFSLKEISTLFPRIYEDIHCEDRESMLNILNYKTKELNDRINELTECRDLILKLQHNIEINDHSFCDGLNIYNH
jgi:DNA-binding transcriptional MerR regulator